MAGFSTFLENEVLDHVFLGAAYSAPADVYVALYTAAPTDAGGGTEVSGGSYAREIIVFGTPSAAGAIANTALIDFGTTSAAWGTVTHFGVFDALTVGNLLAWDALTAQKVIGSGDPVSFPIGDLDITLD